MHLSTQTLSSEPIIWLRTETNPFEYRAPIAPWDAKTLIAGGQRVVVERCPQRTFPDHDYANAGCQMDQADSWRQAPDNAYILGLKAPGGDDPLKHRHVFFGHAYRDQEGATELLARFMIGGGTLLDLESLVDDHGKRVATFGWWAGYVGAVLAIRQFRASALGNQLDALAPATKAAIDAYLNLNGASAPPRALITGSQGRCGRGAVAALEQVGAEIVSWGRSETARPDYSVLRECDLMIHAAGVSTRQRPLLTRDTLDLVHGRLRAIVDVTCDHGSLFDILPIYDRLSTWQHPVQVLAPNLSLIAIDNLPSLIPKESSIHFSAVMADLLPALPQHANPWLQAESAFQAALASAF